MSTYPVGIVSSAQLPTRVDGAVIYGSHMNLVQDEIIQIENVLGVGTTLVDGFATLVDRLAYFKTTLADYTSHKVATTGVHGVAGSVVGTTDTQTLTNKTITAPTLTGTVAASGVAFSGNLTFSNNVVFSSSVTLTPTILDFTSAQHDHSSAAKGGNIPMSSVTGLTTALSGTSTSGHTHVKVNITDFQHTLAEHTGSLDIARLTGFGTSATLNVPVSAGAAAQGTQVVRGDDPRLADARTPTAHNTTHYSTGSDPLTAANIGAAAASHTHLKAQITDFAHLLSDHSGALPISSITGLQTALDNKLGISATAADSVKVGGKKITVSHTSAPAAPAVGDVWIDY